MPDFASTICKLKRLFGYEDSQCWDFRSVGYAHVQLSANIIGFRCNVPDIVCSETSQSCFINLFRKAFLDPDILWDQRLEGPPILPQARAVSNSSARTDPAAMNPFIFAPFEWVYICCLRPQAPKPSSTHLTTIYLNRLLDCKILDFWFI